MDEEFLANERAKIAEEQGLTSEELTKLLDAEWAPWNPEPGDSVVGTVREVTEVPSEYGAYPMVKLETDDGKTLAVHAFHTVLRRRFEGPDPITKGARIGIKYVGVRKEGTPNEYKDYNVVIA